MLAMRQKFLDRSKQFLTDTFKTALKILIKK